MCFLSTTINFDTNIKLRHPKTKQKSKKNRRIQIQIRNRSQIRIRNRNRIQKQKLIKLNDSKVENSLSDMKLKSNQMGFMQMRSTGHIFRPKPIQKFMRRTADDEGKRRQRR